MMDRVPVVIGNDVFIGPRAQLLTAPHPLDDHELRRQHWEAAAPVTIGDNVWLGGSVIVCPDVMIGANIVVGAGSVLTSDLPAGVFAADESLGPSSRTSTAVSTELSHSAELVTNQRNCSDHFPGDQAEFGVIGCQ
ncbi:DapH/DapD/GlmU-related protein [Nocardia noduli]|uniref:DapH/DapD/GlmU-related protein n=1 Tax=Nocardia noduli TaxID=2815722 RepID=UPI001C21952C|nr:DapH/DapD/GlmU-related protein [Nocardia noduli]